MKQIIFVCLGNICRSPMAEMIMQNLITNQNLNSQIQVKSCATSTYEIGNSPHPGTIAELKEHNIPIIEHYARQITLSDFEQADIIIGMDQQNIIDLKQMAPVEYRNKIYLAYEAIGKKLEVQDPWYDHKFDRTYRQLNELLPIWLEKIMN